MNYLGDIDVAGLTKAERRKLVRKKKKELQSGGATPKDGSKQGKVRVKMTKEQRREKYTKKAKEQREKAAEKRRLALGYQGTRHTARDASKLYCLFCRGKGHLVADCKKKEGGEEQGETCLCFRCGSKEHRLKDCKKRSKDQSRLPFATCFICSAKGHLASQCQENENGIYPKGGCCKLCSSKKHLA
ncbi:unnamed protein product, partial [Chrysoparadoxa australica]